MAKRWGLEGVGAGVDLYLFMGLPAHCRTLPCSALQWLTYTDFSPMMECVLLYHPGLEFLKVREWVPARARYWHADRSTVVHRILPHSHAERWALIQGTCLGTYT